MMTSHNSDTRHSSLRDWRVLQWVRRNIRIKRHKIPYFVSFDSYITADFISILYTLKKAFPYFSFLTYVFRDLELSWPWPPSVSYSAPLCCLSRLILIRLHPIQAAFSFRQFQVTLLRDKYINMVVKLVVVPPLQAGVERDGARRYVGECRDIYQKVF